MRICNIKSCDNKHYGKGYCRKHYTRYVKHGSPYITKREKHGMGRTSIYSVWTRIKTRCLNPKERGYKDYGGRGIKICDRWKVSFLAFYEDMGEIPEGLEIDRIDNDGNYEPNNCHWVTHKENSRNRRDIVLSLKIANNIRNLRKEGLELKKISKKLNIKMHHVKNVLYEGSWR